MHQSVIIGTAQRPGTEAPCADGHDVQRTGDRVTAAVVDGAGHHPDTVRYAGIAPAGFVHEIGFWHNFCGASTLCNC